MSSDFFAPFNHCIEHQLARVGVHTRHKVGISGDNCTVNAGPKLVHNRRDFRVFRCRQNYVLRICFFWSSNGCAKRRQTRHTGTDFSQSHFQGD